MQVAPSVRHISSACLFSNVRRIFSYDAFTVSSCLCYSSVLSKNIDKSKLRLNIFNLLLRLIKLLAGRIELSDIASWFDSPTLRHLKSECGGLQTLLRNKHQIFRGLYLVQRFISFKHYVKQLLLGIISTSILTRATHGLLL